jgi:hypothetical protein
MYYFGSTDAQHLASFKRHAETFDLIHARIKTYTTLCTPAALSDVVYLRELAGQLLIDGGAGAEAADKTLVQTRVIDAENVANAYVRKLGEECLGKPAPQTVTSAADAIAAVNALSTGGKVMLAAIGGLLVGGGVIALATRR